MDKVNKKTAAVIKRFEYMVLLVITMVTMLAVSEEIFKLFETKMFTLAEILLLFIYLEVFTMVSIFLTSGEFPVKIPLYIGIAAVSRYIIVDMKHMENLQLVALGALILMFASATLLIKDNGRQS